MKKVLVGIVVLALAWVGSSWLIGARVEAAYREWLAGQELVPGYDSLRFEIVDYRRSVFSSQVRSCLQFDPTLIVLHDFSDMLCDETRVLHGPLLWTSSGPWLGLGYSRGELDIQALPEDVRSVIAEYTKGASPLTGESWWGFDRSLRGRVMVPSLDATGDLGSLRLGSLVVWLDYEDLAKEVGRTQLLIDDFALETDSMALRIESLDLLVTVTDMIEGLLPLLTATLHVEGVEAFAAARDWGQEDREVGFDLVFEGSSERHGNLLAAEMRLWLDNIVSSANDLLPMDAAYTRIRVEGLDTNALVRLQAISNELEALQTDMMMAVFGSFGEAMDEAAPALDFEALLADMERLTQERMRLLVERLPQPGRTALHLESLLDQGDTRLLGLTGTLDYQGINGENPALEQFETLLSERALMQLFGLNLSLILAEVLPEEMQEMAHALVEAGVLREEAGQFSMTLTLKEGLGELNGEPVTAEELLERLPQSAGAEMGVEDLVAAGCFNEYDDIDDFPDVCWEYGIYPEF
ncbi:DUF945 family protein [Isoalcanivorax indicus]|uniref:DUF945 family protein n=1 Tax=Isoalcanivorax indicus TaxID=2202653 RepID=UPI000DB95138|nr:DUF945 family protein [Isoalcanivorax indicus]